MVTLLKESEIKPSTTDVLDPIAPELLDVLDPDREAQIKKLAETETEHGKVRIAQKGDVFKIEELVTRTKLNAGTNQEWVEIGGTFKSIGRAEIGILKALTIRKNIREYEEAREIMLAERDVDWEEAKVYDITEKDPKPVGL